MIENVDRQTDRWMMDGPTTDAGDIGIIIGHHGLSSSRSL